GQPSPRFPFADQSEAGVLQGLVLREKANQMGMTVTERDVNDFIADLTQKKLSRNQFYNILNGSGTPDDSGPLGVSESDLFRILGQELLIQQVVEALTPPVVKDSPLEIWEEIEPG